MTDKENNEAFGQKLVGQIFTQILEDVNVVVDGRVYLDPSEISEHVSQLIVEVFQEEEIRKSIKDKIRVCVMAIDEESLIKIVQAKSEEAAAAIKPRSFIDRLLNGEWLTLVLIGLYCLYRLLMVGYHLVSPFRLCGLWSQGYKPQVSPPAVFSFL